MINQKPDALDFCQMKFVMCLTTEQLVTFVKFVHHETGKAKTAFLEARHGIVAGINKKTLPSFSSNRASVHEAPHTI